MSVSIHRLFHFIFKHSSAATAPYDICQTRPLDRFADCVSILTDIASVGVMNTNRQPGRDAKVPSGIHFPGCGAGTRQTRSTKVSKEFLYRPRRCHRLGRFLFCGSAMSLLLFCPGIGSLKTNSS